VRLRRSKGSRKRESGGERGLAIVMEFLTRWAVVGAKAKGEKESRVAMSEPFRGRGLSVEKEREGRGGKQNPPPGKNFCYF